MSPFARLFLPSLAVLFLGVVLFPSHLLAGSNVVTVSPAKVELTLSPGSEQVRVITVENTTQSPLLFTLSKEDFDAGARADDPFTLVDNGSGTYPLKDMLVVEKSSFELLSGEKISIPITVRIPKDTEPGGRYGSLVVSFRSATSPAVAQAIAVESRIGVLFFVRVAGEVKEEGHLIRFGLFNNARVLNVPSSDAPLLFQIAYENTGEVHLNPYGRLTLAPLFVGTPRIITVDPWVVLPDQVRMREVAVPEQLPPGIYIAALELNRGYGDRVDRQEVRFVVIPGPWGVTFIIVGVLSFFFLLRKSLRLSRSRVH